MSVNIQTPNGLVNISGDKVTANKITSALGYTPADKDEHYTKTEIDNKLNDLPTGDSEHNHDDRYAAKDHYHNEYRKPIWHEITGEGLTIGECYQIELDFSNGHTVILYKNDENGNIASEETVVGTNYYTDYSINDSGDFIDEIYTTKHVYSFYQKDPTEYIVNCVERSSDLSNYYTKTEIDTKNEEFSTDIQNVENSIQDLQNDLSGIGKVVAIESDIFPTGATVGFLKQIYNEYLNGNVVTIKSNYSAPSTKIFTLLYATTSANGESLILDFSIGGNSYYHYMFNLSKVDSDHVSFKYYQLADNAHTHDTYYTKDEIEEMHTNLENSIQDLQNDVDGIGKVVVVEAANFGSDYFSVKDARKIYDEASKGNFVLIPQNNSAGQYRTVYNVSINPGDGRVWIYAFGGLTIDMHYFDSTADDDTYTSYIRYLVSTSTHNHDTLYADKEETNTKLKEHSTDIQNVENSIQDLQKDLDDLSNSITTDGKTVFIDLPNNSFNNLTVGFARQICNEYFNGNAVVLCGYDRTVNYTIISVYKDPNGYILNGNRVFTTTIKALNTVSGLTTCSIEFRSDNSDEDLASTYYNGYAREYHNHDSSYYTKTEVDTKISDIIADGGGSVDVVFIHLTRMYGEILITEALQVYESYKSGKIPILSMYSGELYYPVLRSGEDGTSFYFSILFNVNELITYYCYLDGRDTGSLLAESSITTLSTSNHNHDTLYADKEETNTKLEEHSTDIQNVENSIQDLQNDLSGKADKDHTHDEYYTKEDIDTKNEELSTDIQNVENSIQDIQNALEDEVEYITIDRSNKNNISGALGSFTYKELAQIMEAYDSDKHVVLKIITSRDTATIVPSIMYQIVS